MAIRQDFYSLKQTVSLPSAFEQWFPIWHLIPNNTLGKQITLIPQKYTPLNTFAVGEDIAYNVPKPASATEDALSIALMMAASGGITGAAYGTALLAESFANSGTFSIAKRKDQTGFYFQIGDLKHESYFKIAIEYLTSSVISSIEYATNSRLKKLYLAHGKIAKIRKEFNNIFYVTLCEFNNKPDINFVPYSNLNVWHKNTTTNKYEQYLFNLSECQINNDGELIFIIDKEAAQKQLEESKNAVEEATAEVEVLIQQGASAEETTAAEEALQAAKDQLEEDRQRLEKVENLANIEKISDGDFFTIDNPWVLEDYALLFEYGLNKSSDGFFETNRQKYKAFYEFGEMNIKGVWLQLPKKFTNTDGSKETVFLWKLFTNLPKSMFVLPETESDEKFFGEDAEVGTLDEYNKIVNNLERTIKESEARVEEATAEVEALIQQGVSAKEIATAEEALQAAKEMLQEDKAIAGQIENGTTVRVVLFGAGSKLENFYQPSLIGEYANVDNYYFEIVGHSRLDTIEINLQSANGDVDFMETAGFSKNVDIFQQKFWFVNELYWGSALNWPIGLWQTEQNITSIVTNDYKEEKIENTESGKRETIYNIEWIDANNNKKKETKTITIVSSSIAQQEKKVNIVNSKTTNVSFYAYDVPSSSLSNEEKNKTSCAFLTERFYKPYSSFKFDASVSNTDKSTSTDTAANNAIFGGGSSGGGGATRSWEITPTNYGFYKKYKGWYFYNTGNKKTYKILDATFNNAEAWTVAKPLVEISLTLDGDFSSEIIVGETQGYIFIGVPYPTYSGNHGEMSLYLSSASSLGVTGSNYVYLYGNYYAGTYILSQEVSQFSMIGTTSYGDNIIMGGRNIANVQFSTLSSLPGQFISGVTEKVGNVFKDYLFFIDPRTQCVVYRSGFCAWKFDQQRRLVLSGQPTLINSNVGVSTLKAMKNCVITKMIYKGEKGAIYFFVNPSTEGTAPSHYESYHVSKNSHIDTGLTRLYELEKIKINKEIFFPFEFTSVGSDRDKSTSDVVIDTWFPSKLLNSGECIRKIYSPSEDNASSALMSLINGEDALIGQPSFERLFLYYINDKSTLREVKYLWAYSTGDANIYLFYNINPPNFYIENPPETEDLFNPSRPSVFVLVSGNSGNDFYSPAFNESNKSGGASGLMLLYDFDLRGAVINYSETTCFLFGFTYDRGFGPEDKDDNGKPLSEDVYKKHCFLAMYCFNLNDVFKKDDTYQFTSEDETTTWFGRFPKFFVPSSIQTKKTYPSYGMNKSLFGHQLNETKEELDDYNNISKSHESSQYLVSILDQNDATFYPENISVTISNGGIITLFVYVENLTYMTSYNSKKIQSIQQSNQEAATTVQELKDELDVLTKSGASTNAIAVTKEALQYAEERLKEGDIAANSIKPSTVSGIVSLLSSDNGITWVITTDKNEKPILYNDYATQRTPYQLGNFLFLIDSDTNILMFKEISGGINSVVAQNVLPQKIYATMQENGLIYVYYIVDGNPIGSFSNDGGVSWQYLTNW